MPVINPMDIVKVNKPLNQGFDIGTLVTDLKYNDLENIGYTKMIVFINRELQMQVHIKNKTSLDYEN